MSLYYNNFKYLDKNSIDQGLMVTAFDPDDGFMDSFLSMEPIQEDYYDGTKKFDYGAKYNSTYVVNITVIKSDKSDFLLSEVRSLSRWLTGSRTNSWLEVGPSINNIKYSFLGRVTNLQPRKFDGRTIGFLIEFTSITPWAFSSPQEFNCDIGQSAYIDNTGMLIRKNEKNVEDCFGCCVGEQDEEWQLTLCPGIDDNSLFLVERDRTNNGVIAYVDNTYRTNIDNESDDLYTYIYLDIDYKNIDGTYIHILNSSLDEEAIIENVEPNEEITISSKQFIISKTRNKVFGSDFNFVWPRLKPGTNKMVIGGDGHGSAKFAYRFPMKIGDCAMDTEDIGEFCGNE